MSNRMPSLLALLGLAAVAGYQNRDKLKGLLDGARSGAPAGTTASGQDDQTGLSSRAEPGLVSTLQTGLSELVARFTQSGDDATAKSWVSAGLNLPVTPDRLGTVLGDGMLTELAAKTGLARDDLLSRLAQVLPETVDRMTPDGIIQLQEPRVAG